MTDNSARELLLDRLADEFVARYRRGQRPSLEEYVDRHPELADDIRQLFPALAEVEQVKEVGREVAAPLPARGPLPVLERLGDYRIVREVGRGGMGVVYEAEQVSLGRHVALKVLPQTLLTDPRARRRFEREAKAAAKLHHTNIVPVFGVGEHDGLPYYVMQFISGQGLDAVLDELRQLSSGAAEGSALPMPRGDATVVHVARSSLTAEFSFRPPQRQVDSPPTEGPGTVPPSDLTTISSSVVLPGSGTGRRPTYWQSVARVGVQVALALEHAHAQGVLHRDVKPSNLLLDTRGTVWVTDF